MQYTPKFNQLVVESLHAQGTFVKTFVTHTPGERIKKMGKLFGLIEIASQDVKVLELIEVIIQELQTAYYAQELGIDSDIELLFESALQKTNLAIAAFIESEQITLNLDKINIIIGVMHEKQLFFTITGSVSPYLLQPSKSGYRIINILEVTKTPIATPHPLKMFSQVIVGGLTEQHIFVTPTSNVLDYMSLEKLKNVLTEAETLIQGVTQLRIYLEQLQAREHFALIVSQIEEVVPIQQSSIHSLQEFNYEQAADKDSMNVLAEKQKETEKILTPSFLPEMKKISSIFRTATSTYLEKISSFQKKSSSRRGLSINATKLKETISSVVQKTTKKLGSISLPSLSLPSIQRTATTPDQKSAAPQAYTQKSNPQTKKTSTLQTITGFVVRTSAVIGGFIGKQFQKLPMKSRWLLISLVIIAGVLTYNIIWSGIKQEREARIAAFNQAIEQIRTNKNEAEASLIYRDENQARATLRQAQDALAAVDPVTEEEQQQVDQLYTEIEELLSDLRYESVIESPAQLLSFLNLNPEARLAPTLDLRDGQFFVHDLQSGNIYSGSLQSKELTELEASASLGTTQLSVLLDNNQILYFNQQQALQALTTSNQLQPLTISLANTAQISDMFEYNNRLYLLDAINQQIYRHDRAGTNYSAGSSWITSTDIDLSSAVGLAIDAEVYVLLANGEIVKFNRGSEVAFDVKTVDPPLSNVTKLYTSDNTKFLYILEPSKQRVIVLSKEGSLVRQYVMPSLQNISDFVVDEAAARIYLLNDAQIFAIPLEHI